MVSFTHYLNHLSLTNKLVVVSDDIIPAATPRLHNIQYNNLGEYEQRTNITKNIFDLKTIAQKCKLITD